MPKSTVENTDHHREIQDILRRAQLNLACLKRNRRTVQLSPQALDAARNGLDDQEAPEMEGGDPATAATLLPPQTRSGGESVKTLEEVREDLGECMRCKLHTGRTNIVFGVGNPRAELMFVGEGPGADEDRQGEPFVGRAGQLLTRMIAAMGKGRQDVYIANVVKCRPPENRDPERDEVAACLPFLKAQIAAISPKILCTLGNPATRTLLDTKVGITKMRGSFSDYEGIPVMPTFHPSYLLRDPRQKKLAWEDLLKIMDRLGWSASQRRGA